MSLTVAESRIAVIGLGYVGLPLAIELGTRYPTIGFDISHKRVASLNIQEDTTLEVRVDDFERANHLQFSNDAQALEACNVYIVTVPTPIDEHNRPDCGPLVAASQTIASVISAGNIVIYESTVYPGATEEVCVPEIEQASGLRYNVDFFAGYSPERINPGDKTHKLPDIKKVTSGSTPETAKFVDALYSSIVTAGTYMTSSIRVAEAAKVIENTQRDLNIALVNELALIFNRLDIDTEEVLQAAGTKWNFLPFRPGLVGGHCIGVDPYYLTHKAQSIGYHPEVILAGRRINDRMGGYVAEQIIKLMTRDGINPVGAHVLIMGLAFKENCPDIRNSKVVDVISGLDEYSVNVQVYDPWVDPIDAYAHYGVELLPHPAEHSYDAIVMAVAHDEFRALDETWVKHVAKPDYIVYDVKNVLPPHLIHGRL